MNVAPSGDWVDRTVREIWRQTPGIGVKAMREEILKKCEESSSSAANGTDVIPSSASSLLPFLSAVPDPTKISKARVKHSQAFIPYQKLENETIKLTDAQQKLVETKIQERMAFRASRDFRRADQFMKALEAMGVQVDDRLKTWQMVKEPPSQLEIVDEADSSAEECKRNALSLATKPESNKNACKFCHKVFPSRNHVFRHLRDPTSGCGTAIFASGQHIEEPPSAIESRLRKEAYKARKGAKRMMGQTSVHASLESSLWVGDLPFVWTDPRKQFSLMRSLLYQYLPRDIPTPWIKRVIRKGYHKEPRGSYYGYAIVVFRDAAEAQHALGILDGQFVDPAHVLQRHKGKSVEETSLFPFTLKVGLAEKPDPSFPSVQEQNTFIAKGDTTPGEVPAIIEQLRPLDSREMLSRLARMEGEPADSHNAEKFPDPTPEDDSDKLLSRLAKLYEQQVPKRIYIERRGNMIPTKVRNRLLSILSSLRWPARNDRGNLTSERYLVLQTNVSSDRFFGDLRDACRELMDWVDADYYYSGIAVTKNFVGSPHIDHRDQSFQYAVSLGDFHRGGELCVEGIDSSGREIVNVIDTQNRVAKVDGRHVHFVRTWTGGDRYSLIFYDTSDRHPTPIIDLGIDETFLEA